MMVGMGSRKAQSSIEYLFVFSFSLAIIAIVGSLLINSASSIAPSICNFDQYMYCADAELVTNSTSSVFVILGSNMYEYPFSSLSLSLASGSYFGSSSCFPKNVEPGGDFVCIVKLNKQVPIGAYFSGKLNMHAKACTLFSCGIAGENFAGTFGGKARPFSNPLYYLQIVPLKNSNAFKVSLYLFGQSVNIDNANVTSSGANVSRYQPLYQYGDFFKVLGNASNNTYSLKATWGNLTSNYSISLKQNPQSSSIYCFNESEFFEDLLMQVLIAKATKYPPGTSFLTCPVIGSEVYCASNVTSYYSNLSLAEKGSWLKTTPFPASAGALYACISYYSYVVCASNSGFYYSNASLFGLGPWTYLNGTEYLSSSEC
ncbi:MAG: hypothetical protein QXL16_02945 [Candidatus Micrarchaeaceae archaeon]